MDKLKEQLRTSYDNLVSLYGEDMVRREIELEIETKEDTYNAFIAKRNKALGKSQLGTVGTTKEILTEAIPVLSSKIQEFYDKANSGKVGKRHKVVELLRVLPAEIVAFVTLQQVLSKAFEVQGLTKASQTLGDAIEKEARYQAVLDTCEDAKDRQDFVRGLTKRVGFLYKYAYVRNKEKLIAEDGKCQRWKNYSPQQKCQIGLKLIELLVSSTGLAQIIREADKKGYIAYKLRVDPDIVNYIEHNDYEFGAMLFNFEPMLIPPLPWTTIDDGGYLLNLKNPVRLVRVRRRICEALYRDIDMPEVYKAVNTIQATPWRVNKKVYDVVSQISDWRNIPEGLDLPLAEPAEPPVRPEEANENREVQKAWRKSMTRYYQQDNVRKGKRFLVNAMLKTAKKYLNEDRIYFPHNVDFRGRIYPLTRFSPQGNDMTKALIEFADGVPLGEHGATWLAIQGANMWGLDKKPFKERLEWVYSNGDLINNIANSPLEHLEWCDADEPFEFLAFCFEWAEYLKVGEGFESRLAVAFDGSCSGLQHFSAMLCDEGGGRAVNLVPDDKVHDIYTIVAKKVIEYLKVDEKDGTEDVITSTEQGDRLTKGTKSMAKEWLAFGVNRKVTKRPTMTLCYGACQYGFGNQVLEDTIEPAIQKNPLAFSRPRQSAVYMAKLIWRALQNTVTKAVEAMDWLQETSALLANDTDLQGKHMPTYWVTPAGFPVTQAYKKKKLMLLKSFIAGNIYVHDCRGDGDDLLKEGTAIQLTFQKDDEETIDVRKQKNGIAPNFVHSMDASHLMLTVNRCYDRGIRGYAMIHDSYGCHAGDGDIMFNTVREVFVETYTSRDVLQELHDHVATILSPRMLKKLQDPPKKGSLDLEKVKESLYAFS